MDQFVERVVCAYRQMVPFKVLFEQCKIWRALLVESKCSWTCLACQEKIFRLVIEDPHCKLYPPLGTYTARFLRQYIDEIELANDELYEDLLEKYVSLIHSTDDSHVCYKSYTLPNNYTFPIQVSTQCNEVGMVTWDASFLLCEYVISNPELFRDKCVLELGSGVGLLGMVLANFTKPMQVTLTDHAPPVLKNLLQNLISNGFREDSFEEKNVIGVDFSHSLLRESKGTINGNSISVKMLEWFGCVENNSLPLDSPHCDLIVAADVVYALDLASVVPKVLSLLFKRNPAAAAIVAITVRNEATFALFMSQLQICKLAHEDLLLGAGSLGHSPILYDRSSVVLFKITPTLE